MNGSNVEHVVVFRDDANEWRWHAKAANGEIVATGESHSRPEDAERAARGVFGDDTLIVRDNGFDADTSPAAVLDATAESEGVAE